MDKKLTFVKCFIALTVLCIFTERTFAQITFTPKTDIAITTGLGAMFMTTADINSDGRPDLITANQTAPGTISILLNTTVLNSTTPSFSAQTDLTCGQGTHSVSAGDINGDGLLDLVAVNTTAATASVFLNTTTPGASTPTFSAKTDFTTGTNPYSVVLKDMNGDGKPDIVCANQVGNSIGVFINTTNTGASTPSFGAMTAFTTPAGPTHMAVADLNGDGLPDVVVPNNTAASVSIFFNTTTVGSSTPTFGTRVDLTAGTTVWSVSIADFNLDGKPDIICANRGTTSVSYFLNTTATGSGTPSFTAKTDLTVGSTPWGATVGDLNCDGKPDILCGQRGSAQFSVFLNNTDPNATSLTLLTRTDYTTANQPYFPVVVDLNGDGKPDVACNTGTGNAISVFINTTDLSTNAPSFSAQTLLSTTGAPQDVCSADFNGDGKPDFACTNYGSSTISVSLNTVVPGASTPSFSSATTFAANQFVIGIWSADFNGDGKPDLACINFGPSLISVYINTTAPGASTPSFTAKTDFAATNAANYLVAADFNGDGRPDLACTDMNNTSMSVLLNTTTPGSTTPSFTAKTTFTAGTSPNKIVAADLNGDGKADIIVGNRDANSISVYINTTTPGASTPTFTAKTDFAVTGNAYGLGAGDFNGDGRTDIACSNGSVISVFLNTTTLGATTPTFSAKTDFAITRNANYICTSDFNGDGKPDLGYTNASGGTNYCSVYLNNTTPGSSTPDFNNKTDYTAGSGPLGITASDFNLDGKKDLICANGNSSSISVYLNTAVYALPVELSSFTSNVNGNNIILNWNTVSEENNSGFDIERNSFGTGWTKVGFVAGKGTINTQQNYSFTDNGLNSGSYNYRLKQIDYNGNYKYYDLQNEVVIGVPNKFALMQNYPNPFNPITIINYQLSINSFVTLKIFDISGREVKQLVNEVQQAGYYAVDFNASSLSSGTYFYKLTSANFSDVKKMILVK